MRPGVILLLAVAFAGGGLLGYVLGSGRVRDPLPSDPVPSEPAPDLPVELILKDTRPTPQPHVLDDPAELAIVRGTGDGRIFGVVLDGEGRPVSDVLVQVHRPPPSPPAVIRSGGGLPEDMDLESVAREAVRQERLRRELRWEAVTGPDGAYEVTGLVRTRHTVRAWKEGCEISRAPSSTGRTVPDARRDFVALRVAGLIARVLGPDGEVMPEAYLVLRCGALRRRVAWRPGEPPHRFPPGEWSVSATGGRLHDLASEKAQVVLGAGEPATVVLHLTELPGVCGRVLNRTRENISVQVLLLKPGQPSDPEALIRGGSRAAVYHGPDAVTYFRALTPGRYLVGLVQDHGRLVESATVEVNEGRVARDFTVVPPGPEEFLTLRAEGPDGELLTVLHASTQCRVAKPRRWASGGGRPVRQADGTWLVARPVFRGGERAVSGRFILHLDSPIYGRRQVEYAGPSANLVTLRFEKPGRLTVALDASFRTAYRGSVKILVRRFEESEEVNVPCPGFGKRGADGVQVWDPIAPGRHEVIVGADLWNTWDIPVARREITIRSGDNRLEIALPKLQSLNLQTDEYPKTRFTLWYVTTPEQPMTLTIDGNRKGENRMLFENLPPGTYHLNGSGDAGTMTVRIPGPTELRFRPDD